MAKLDRFIIDNTTYELVPEIAPLFNPATPYSVGDCVIHDAVLYKFTADHAAGAWTGNDVVAFEVGKEVAKVNGLERILHITDSISARFTSGSYAIGAIGTVVDDPSTSSSTMMKAEFECSANDIFMINIYGSGTNTGGARAYAFLDSNRCVLERAAKAVLLSKKILIAPENAEYLVINTMQSYIDSYAIKGNLIAYKNKSITSSLSDKINAASNCIDYGYLEESELIEEPENAYTGRKVGVKQILTEVTLNASNTISTSVRIKLSGGEVKRSSTVADVENWTDGVLLKAGHVYKASAHYISGSITVTNGTQYPGVSVYKVGTSVALGQRFYDGYDSELTFEADEDEINLLMYINSGTVLSNAKYQVLLQDISYSANDETDNIYIGPSTISGTADQLYHKVLIAIDNASSCEYNFEWDYYNTVYESGSTGPTIAALDSNGDNVLVTSAITGESSTSISLSNYSSFVHRSFSIIFPAEAKKIVFGSKGSPDANAVYYFRNIKITKLPSESVKKWPNYYPNSSLIDYVSREESKYYSYLHDGAILRMSSLPDAIPVNENHLGYNEFISQTWDTLLPDNYQEGDVYSALTTKIPNVKVERASRWSSTPYSTNVDTYTIYRYIFTPQNGYEKTVLLTSGCHGNEAEGYWGLFRLIKMIFFEGYKYPTLRNLRNVRYIIVPSWNPWGMQHYRRYNAFSALNTSTYDGGKTHQAWNWLFNENHSLVVNNVTYDIEDVGEANVIWETLQEYNNALSLWIDFHTDPYAGRSTENVDIDDPRAYEEPYGCYGYSSVGSKTFYRMSDVITDFKNILKDEYNFESAYNAKASAPGIGLTSWQATLGFPCALVEVSTFMDNFPYPSGSAQMMKIAQEYYANCLSELLRP